MRLKAFKSLTILILMFFTISINAQIEDWIKLVALESERADVEKILGNPEIYFETYGLYKTKQGKFHVWYSKGGCRNNVEGLQWNVPAGKLTGILFYPSKSLSLESDISNLNGFEKRESPAKNSRYLYISSDESLTYETILPKNSKEFIYSIELAPSKDKQSLLCKNTIEK